MVAIVETDGKDARGIRQRSVKLDVIETQARSGECVAGAAGDHFKSGLEAVRAEIENCLRVIEKEAWTDGAVGG